MTYHKPIKAQEKEVFNQDLLLMGFGYDDIRAELQLLRSCPEMEDYIRASRIGKKVKLTRAVKKEIYLSYELWVKED